MKIAGKLYPIKDVENLNKAIGIQKRELMTVVLMMTHMVLVALLLDNT